jgi:phosphodiesterase/alkaline phosphatase D-like protein
MRRILAIVLPVALIAAAGALAAGSFAAGSPSVSTGNATGITNTGAVVNGTVNPEGQSSTNYAFQYGTSTMYGHETTLTPVSGTTTLNVSATLAGLVPGTTYHYRIIATSNGGTTVGADGSFKTTGTAPPPPPVKPVATTGASSSVTSSGATVAGTVNPSGLATTYYFEFGTSSAYGYQTTALNTPAGVASVAASASLSGLQSQQTYHYRLVAVNAGGTSLGTDATFKTAAPPAVASHMALFGRTGFVSPSGVAGVLAGCLGQTPCTGAGITISRGGVTLASRGDVSIGAEDGGVIHVSLNAAGQATIGTRHHLRVNVTLTDAAGKTTSGVMTLVQFS